MSLVVICVKCGRTLRTKKERCVSKTMCACGARGEYVRYTDEVAQSIKNRNESVDTKTD